MKTLRTALGSTGEDMACELLMNAGQQILERNWRCGHLEIDIITMDSYGLHFVEVKSRTAPVTADPLESVTAAKRRNMTKAAMKYVRKGALRHGIPQDAEIFFDIITIIYNGDTADVRYYPQAFIPLYT